MSDERGSSRWRHDMKNQLGIILGFSELLLDEMDAADPRRPDIQEIQVAAGRIGELLAVSSESRKEDSDD